MVLTKNDLQQITNIVRTELNPVKKDVKKIKKDLRTTIDFFDNIYLKLNKRVDRIDSHLNLPPLSI